MLQNWPDILKIVEVMKVKDSVRNSRLKQSIELWKVSAVWHPGLDPFTKMDTMGWLERVKAGLWIRWPYCGFGDCTVNFWVLMVVVIADLEENVLVYRNDSANSVGVIDPWCSLLTLKWASLMGQTVKRLPAMQETRVRSLGRDDPLEKEMAASSITLAWKIPWTEEPGGLPSIGSPRVGRDWVTSLSFSISLGKLSYSNLAAF